MAPSPAPPPRTAADALRMRALTHPHAPALVVVDATGAVTFALDARALDAAVSRASRALCSTPRHRTVVVSTARDGADALITLLAAARARRTVCTVDTEAWPPARCRAALDAARAKDVVCGTADDARDVKARLGIDGDDGVGIIVMDAFDDDLGELDANEEEEEVEPNATWYLAFTSGTTGGAPKPVPATHDAVMAYARNKIAVERIQSDSVVVLASNATFDLYMGDACAAVLAGATCAASSRAMIQSDFARVVRASGATHVCCTPTVFSLLRCAPSEVPTLRCVTLAGEKMSTRTLETWAPAVELYNAYGVTETTVVQTYARMRVGDDARRAGKAYAIDGFACVYIAKRKDKDEDEDECGATFIDDAGVAGEIVIGGACVSAGYVGDVARTAEAFVNTDRGRVYFTGDDGYVDESGELYVLGRRDRQVKIRGYRVELDEIEVVLRACDALVANAVVFYDVNGDDAQFSALTAHVQLRRDDDAFDDGVYARALERWARHRMPTHAVPLRYVFVDFASWPMTSSGKTCRMTLRERLLEGVTSVYRPRYEAPRNGVERALARIWMQALGLRDERGVGALDAFDAIGGTSLNVLVVSRALVAEKSLRLAPNSSTLSSSTIGLTDGEAAALLPNDDEPAACTFGVIDGPFAPCEIFARPVLRDYADYLIANGVAVDDDDNKCLSPSSSTSDMDDFDADARCMRAACGRGVVGVVCALLRSGVAPDAECLRAAAASPSPRAISVVHALLDAGADVSVPSRANTLATHIAAARGNVDMLEELIRRAPVGCAGVKDADKQTILHLAVRSGDIATIRVAITACAPLKTRQGGLEAWDRWKRTGAAWALRLGDAEAVSALRDAGAKLTDLELHVADTWRHGTLSQRTLAQRELRPSRKREASIEMMTALGERLANSTLDAEHRVEAASAVRELACASGANRDACRRLGIIPSLCALVREQHCVESIGALRNVAYNASTENQTVAGDAGAVEILSNVIRSRATSLQDHDDDSEDTIAAHNRRIIFAAVSALKSLTFKHEANTRRVADDIIRSAKALCNIDIVEEQ
jgi:acyl-coenzyme A synthetase/AMP-(fatty) acid ligase